MAPVIIPDPNSSRPRDIEITLNVHPHAIRYAAATLFLSKEPAVFQLSIRAGVVHANLMLFRIVDIKALTIGRECQTIGLSKLAGQQADGAVHPKAVHALKRNLLF